MGQELKNKVVVLEPCTKVVEELLKTISDRKQAELVRVSIPEEAIQLVRQFQPCMLVICLQENNELPQRVSLLKNLESSIKYGLLKSLFVSKIKNKQIGSLITSLGTTDFIEEPVPLRTLQFKTNLQLKAVETIRKQQEMKLASQEKIVFKKNGKSEKGAESADPQAKPTPALQIDEDSFLFKNSGVKKAGKKLVVELEGPDPASGQWIPHEDQGNAQAAWRWVPEEKKDSPEAQRGDGWIHSGDKPQFQGASRKWQMASEAPSLAYQKDGKKVAKKISTNAAGEVSVAADSPIAEANIKKARIAAAEAQERKANRKAESSEAKSSDKPNGKKDAAPVAEESHAKTKLISESEPNLPSAPTPEKKESALNEKESAETSSAVIGEAVEPNRVVELKERRERKEAKKAKNPALSPLEFLKKKKKERDLEIGAQETQEDDKKAAEIQIGAEERAAAPDSPRDSEEVTAPEEGRARKRNRSEEALSRLREKAEKGLEPEEEVEAAESSFGAAQTEETEGDAEETQIYGEEKARSKRTASPSLIGEEKEKRKKELAQELVGLSAEERKKKVMQKVQDIISEPLPEKLPPAEEKRLRKKFGLEDAPEVSAAALARKERIEQVKALKEGLLDFEQSELAQAPETRVHDLSEEESENTWSKKQIGMAKAVSRRAFDSELEEATGRESSRSEAEERGEIGASASGGEDPYFYLPEVELRPVGNAWEKAGEHQVYLAGEIRYRGFTSLRDLLPIWIYRGEHKPELLDKTKQWRFLGSLPFSATTVKEIPADVRDFLLALKSEQDSEQEAESSESLEALAALAEITEEESAKTIGEEPKADTETLFESFERETKAAREAGELASESEAPANQAAKLQEIFGKKKNAAESGSLLESLQGNKNSPAIEKFLERRRNKEKRAAAPNAETQKSEATNPYLGILVALSNSFSPTQDGQRSLGRVLKAVELSFGKCSCAVLGPKEPDGLSAVQTGPAHLPPRMDPAGARPIRSPGDEKIVGYLILSPTEGRNDFSTAEEAIIEKVITSIWPAVIRGIERKAA